jgi:hypothetical protein
MTVTILADALKEFNLALDDFTSNLEFIRSAARLRPRLSEMLHWSAMDSDAKKLADTFLKQGNAEERVLYRGMVVLLSGAFEQFVRRVIRDCVTSINKSVFKYDALDEKIQKQHVYRTGIALQTIHEPLDHLVLDYEGLGKNLGTCFNGSNDYSLNADAFTIFMSVISPKSLVDALDRLGLNINWDDLGRVQGLQDHFGKSDTRETAKAIQDFLKDFGRTRNKIAHTGNSGVVITESDFSQLLKMFRIFASAFSAVIESELAKTIRRLRGKEKAI